MSELKFVITGTAGVGKTTAIAAISDIPPVSTDAETTDELRELKQATTVAFDFGEVIVNEDTRVRIYGTPGQDRFRHMWEILSEGALGLVILVDDSRPDPIADLDIYVSNFKQLIDETGLVVGVTRTEVTQNQEFSPYYEYLESNDIFCPVMAVDPRRREDMADVMDALMAVVEYA
ncbi:ATP/GTP-binding protein [Aurantivibrio plasticivorans]